jgi:hypothetical protein
VRKCATCSPTSAASSERRHAGARANQPPRPRSGQTHRVSTSLDHDERRLLFQLIVSSKRRTDDQEFPLEEAEKSYQWAKHVYRLYEAEEAASDVESTTAHGYQEDKRELLYRAVERWLRPPRPKGDKELPAQVETFEA